MNTEQILMCVVALILGMLLANMLKSVCGCKNLIEGQSVGTCSWPGGAYTGVGYGPDEDGQPSQTCLDYVQKNVCTNIMAVNETTQRIQCKGKGSDSLWHWGRAPGWDGTYCSAPCPAEAAAAARSS